MKMITRCPACATAFRIYREQLDARGGKVRCGYCAVVFDAHHDLSIEPEMPDGLDTDGRPPLEPTENSTAAAASDASEDFAIAADEDAAPDSSFGFASDDGPSEDFPFPTAPAEDDGGQAHSGLTDPLAAVSEQDGADAIDTATSDMLDDGIGNVTGNAIDEAAEPAVAAQLEADVSLEELGFAPAPVRPRWQTALWTLLALVLGLSLCAQLTYFYRDQLIAWVPQSQPWLAAACEQLGCSVPPPQRADLISIESSELQIEPNAPDVLTLSAVLRNRAAFTQAYPALELTLTNEANLTVARRVLQPKDYLAGSSRLGKSFDTGSEMSFKLHIDAAGLGASGYRLYVFNL